MPSPYSFPNEVGAFPDQSDKELAMRIRYFCLAGLLFAGSLFSSAEDLATIVGTVTDPSGAAVPNANVTVSNPAVGFSRGYQSNSAGEYTAARIPLGGYVVTAKISGF